MSFLMRSSRVSTLRARTSWFFRRKLLSIDIAVSFVHGSADHLKGHGAAGQGARLQTLLTPLKTTALLIECAYGARCCQPWQSCRCDHREGPAPRGAPVGALHRTALSGSGSDCHLRRALHSGIELSLRRRSRRRSLLAPAKGCQPGYSLAGGARPGPGVEAPG